MSPDWDSLCCGLGHEVAEVDDDAVFCPFGECAEATSRHHDGDWFAGCWVHQCLFLQVRHLAALGFDVAVTHVSCRQWGFPRDYANFAHKNSEFRMPECYRMRDVLARMSAISVWVRTV